MTPHPPALSKEVCAILPRCGMAPTLAAALAILTACTRPALFGGPQLRLHLTQGSTYRFHATLDERRRPEAPGRPQPESVRHAEFDLVLAVQGAAGERIRLTASVSGVQETRSGPQDLAQAPPMREGLTFTAGIDARTGALAGLNGPEAEALAPLLRLALAELPESGAAQAGESWTVHRPVPIAEAGRSCEGRVALERATGGIARLATHVDAPLDLSFTARTGTVSVEGTWQVAGNADVDLGTGVARRASEAATARWRQVELSPTGPLTTDYTVTTNLQIERMGA